MSLMVKIAGTSTAQENDVVLLFTPLEAVEDTGDSSVSDTVYVIPVIRPSPTIGSNRGSVCELLERPLCRLIPSLAI
ncbi:hypothetical protein CGRA01v4_07108 [Colletotrichum graminicola]|nr:hypothetical protein CGRA01v4_07108 [Colletotrichum graminicola]